MSGAGSEATGQEQVRAIGSFSSALDARGIDYWLFGGWAVDFHVNAITRPHDDIDVVAWRDDAAALGAAVETAGWVHTPTENDVVGTRYRLGTIEAEVTFVVSDDAGRIVVPLREGPIVWSETSFGTERRELYGVAARTIPLDLLLAGKAVPREGAAEREKDLADFAALSQLAP